MFTMYFYVIIFKSPPPYFIAFPAYPLLVYEKNFLNSSFLISFLFSAECEYSVLSQELHLKNGNRIG